MRIKSLNIILFFSLWMISCGETFEPWQENDQYHFSIYGYLDASADTQWVRIMPVREELFYEPKPLDATVTLEHVESGESAVMEDSLFSYFQGYAWNFSSVMNIEPGQTYTLTARYPDGRASQATVQLPEDFPTPILHMIPRIPGGPPARDELHTEGIERITDVRTVYTYELPNTQGLFSRAFQHLKDTTRVASGDFVIIMNPQEDINALSAIGGPLFNEGMIKDRKIFLASAGPGYHAFPFIDEKITTLPQGISNVTDGTGYLGAIVSKTIPYERCVDENVNFIPCELQQPPW